MQKEDEKPKVKELTEEELEALYRRIEANKLTKEDADLIKNTIKFSLWIQRKFKKAGITLSKLKKLLFGSKSEKSDKKNDEDSESDDNQDDNEGDSKNLEKSSKPKKAKGHGKMSYEAYKGARNESIKHEFYKAGDECPLDCEGRLYNIEPGIIMRIYGQSEADVVKYEVEKLRCSSCLHVFSADTEKIGDEKYDEEFKAILATKKYFAGMPLYRQEQYFKMQGVPLPDSTQWDLIEEVGDAGHPIFQCLEKLAANGKIVYQDDTKYKILNLVKESDSERSGVYTTNLTIETNKNTIVLYYTKNKHAGENLEELLKLRTVKDKIIKMSDALSSNNVNTETIECNCLVHARRKFVEIKDYWPKEASYVIQLIQKIYKNEKEVKKEEMNDAERLLYHQKHSLPIMVEYKRYIEELLIKNKIEPNSSFGAAINYSLNHWENLTRFLSVPGAPIDNNEAERKLKIPIRTRKNSLFYYNLHGALIGSMLMSIIATCLAAGVNAIKYLTELQKNREKVLKNPEAWMPWNFDPMEVS